MLAAAARAGAPLGHDFCAINLSDNLKPWPLIEQRLRLAAQADFAMAFYNPARARGPGFCPRARGAARLLRGERLVLFARAVSTPEEELRIVPLAQARPEMADMRTMVIVGSSQTRLFQRASGPVLYTPRSVPRAVRALAHERSSPARPAHRALRGAGDERAIDHDHRQAQRARGDQLGLRRAAPGVLAHHQVHRVVAQQGQVAASVNGPRSTTSACRGRGGGASGGSTKRST
jgi:hypothetical protein